MKALDLGFKKLTYKNQIKLAEAILIRESFVAGYKKTLMTPRVFQRLFVDWSSADRKQNLKNSSKALKYNKGHNRMGYIVMLDSKYPTFLHEAYSRGNRPVDLEHLYDRT